MRPATIRTLALLAALAAPLATLAQTPPALPATAERPPNQNDRQEYPYWSRPVTLSAAAESVKLAYDRTGITHAICGNVARIGGADDSPITYANDSYVARTASGFSAAYQVGMGQTPSVAVDPSGGVHVVWQQQIGTAAFGNGTIPLIDIFYRKRDPAIGWQTSATKLTNSHVETIGNSTVVFQYFRPVIAVASNSTIHILYLEEEFDSEGGFDVCNHNILHRVNLGAPSTVVSTDCRFPFPAPFVNDASPIRLALDDRPGHPIVPHAAWTEIQPNAPVGGFAKHSSNPGTGWAVPDLISDPDVGGGDPDLAVDAAGVVHFSYLDDAQGVMYRNTLGVNEAVGAGGGTRITVDSRLQPHLIVNSSRYFGKVLGGWKEGRFLGSLGYVSELVITPNDQLLVAAGTLGNAPGQGLGTVTRTNDPDLGEQDAFALFNVGPNASTNVADGNLFFTAPLFSSRGVGISANFSLIYNSLSYTQALISQGWQHNYDVVLTDHDLSAFDNAATNYIDVRFGDGRVVEFKKTASGIYLANNDAFPAPAGRLAKYGHFSKIERGTPTIYSRNDPTKSANYLMTGKFGLEFLFDANGRLVALIDTNKNILTLTQQPQGTSPEGNSIVRLQTLADSAGRATGLEYYTDGRLKKITDPAMRTYTLTYSTDTVPKLMSVSFDATSDVWSFSHYAVNDSVAGYRQNLLALVRTPRGQAADPKYGTTFLYYQDNRFARSIDPPALHVKEDDTEATFSAWRTVAYTNPVPTGTIGADDEYWTAAFTDRRGYTEALVPLHTTTVHYQYFRSIATKIVDPLSKKIVRTFDPDFRNVMNFKDKRGNSTVFTYATTTGFVKDNVETITRPDAPAIQYTYTSASNDPSKNLNRVETIKDARNTPSFDTTTTYEYFLENGNLKKINFPAAPDPCHQDYTYDSKGRVLTSKSPNGFTTDFNYDPQLGGQDVGLVGKIERPGPNGGKLKPEFLSYEKMGITTKRSMPEQPAHPTTFIPDGRDRITDVIDPILAQSHNDFDANSNLTDSKDPRQFANPLLGKTHHDYDNLDRLFKTTNAQNHFAETKYDPNGNVRESRDFDGNISKFKYDELNRTVREERHHSGSPVLVMTFGYDENGNLKTETQDGVAGGGAGTKVTTNAYDKRNNRVRTVMNGTTDGTQIDIAQFDANDNLKVSMRRMVAPNGDPNDPDSFPGVFTSGSAFDYDQRNRMTLQTDLTTDPGSNPQQPPTIQGTQTSFAYDCDNNRTSVTSGIAGGGGCQRTTTFGFDETDRLTSTLGPTSGSGQSEVHYTYDDNGNRKVVQVDNPIGGGLITAQTFNYNDRNEMESSLDAFNNSGSSTFDLNGNLLVRTDEENFKTGMVYDSLNRLVETRVAKTAGQDPLTAPDSAVVRTQFQYDFNGNRTAIIDPRGFQYDFEYDGLNRLVKVKNPLITGEPSRHEESYTYDEFGNRKSFTDANGKYEEMAYDELNRLVADTHWTDATKTTEIVQIVRTYDASNNLLTIDDGTTKLVYAYTTAADAPQPINLVKSVSWLIGGTAFKSVGYTYDACGKRATLTEPEGALVRYTYDGADRLEQILRTAPADIERLFMTMTYDKGGRRKTTAYGNSTTMSYGYDLKSRLVKLQLETNSGDVLSSFGYSYDKRDNRTQTVLEHKSAMFSYGYDALSRLTSETCTGTSGTAPSYGGNTFASLPGGNESAFSNQACGTPGVTINFGYIASYTFDDAGNRLTKSDTRLGNFVYSYDEENRLTTETFDHPPADNVVDETFSYAFDKNGNTITKTFPGGDTQNFSYDYANRMKSFVKLTSGLPTSSFTYTYAPSGERVLKTNTLAGSTTAFMYDGADVVTDYSVPTIGTYAALKSYVQGMGIDSKFAEVSAGGATLFYNNDALGTVHQIVTTPPLNQDATVLETQLTTAWGEDLLAPSQTTRYHFTQRERDPESGLMYFRARTYWPGLGRFGQKDPKRRTISTYSYVQNAPLGSIDPTGMDVVLTDDEERSFGTEGKTKLIRLLEEQLEDPPGTWKWEGNHLFVVPGKSSLLTMFGEGLVVSHERNISLSDFTMLVDGVAAENRRRKDPAYREALRAAEEWASTKRYRTIITIMGMRKTALRVGAGAAVVGTGGVAAVYGGFEVAPAVTAGGARAISYAKLTAAQFALWVSAVLGRSNPNALGEVEEKMLVAAEPAEAEAVLRLQQLGVDKWQRLQEEFWRLRDLYEDPTIRAEINKYIVDIENEIHLLQERMKRP